MKIAFFLTSPNGGGAERAMISVANRLAAAGLTVDVVFGRPSGPRRGEVDPTVGIVDLGVTRLRAMPKPMAAYMHRRQPDVVVSSLMACDVVMLVGTLIFRWKSRVLISIQNHPLEVSRHARRTGERAWPLLIRTLYRRADGIVGISTGVAEATARLLRRPAESVPVIHNPVIMPGFAAQLAAEAGHPWFHDGGGPVILAAGRLTPQKDYPTLLRALAMRAPRTDARLIVIGEGDERAGLERLTERLGIAERVDFAGYVANPYPWMKAARLFVLSSRWEGFGNVVAEALACGTPVVATDCPSGPAEILAGGTYGTLVPVGDARRLAVAIEETLAGSVNKEALISRGMEFTVDRIAPAYRAEIEKLARR